MPHGPHPETNFHLAQLNIATIKYPKDSPEMADFIGALDEINALAESSEGFVWRMKDESGNAMSYTLFDDETLPNMSVWRDRKSLFDYVYTSAHTHYLARRKEWFKMPKEGTMVLWWVPAGHEPSLEEAAKRLLYLREHGPTAQAFTFKKAFDVSGEPV
jgi:quinol monooxygenase YgiN